MLDRKCRKIVKCCYKHFRDKGIIQTDDLQKHLKLDTMEIYYCCNRLNELGYFDIYQTSIVHTVHFVPGYKIFNYKENSRTEIKSFIIKSVIIPIITALVTSLLTTLILQMI
jgi:hypothetical protein